MSKESTVTPIGGLSWIVRETWDMFVPKGVCVELIPPPHPANTMETIKSGPRHKIALRIDAPPSKGTPRIRKEGCCWVGFAPAFYPGQLLQARSIWYSDDPLAKRTGGTYRIYLVRAFSGSCWTKEVGSGVETI